MHNDMQAVCEGDSSAADFRRPGKSTQSGPGEGSRAESKCPPSEWFRECAADTPPFTHLFLLSNSTPETRWGLDGEDWMQAGLLMGSVNVSI